MDEFLDKLQEDQRRMRKFLRAKAERFKVMGEALAAPAISGQGKVYVVGEGRLAALSEVVAVDYLHHLPVEASEDLEALAEELSEDDVLLAFLHEAKTKAIRRLLERARAREATILIVGGLGAKSKTTKRQATALLTLPTRGIKTIVESVFLSSRLLGRISRGVAVTGEELPSTPPGSSKESGVRATSESRRAKRKKRSKSRRLKPSVLELPTLKEEDLESSPPKEESAPLEAASKSEGRSRSESKLRSESKPKSESKPRESKAKSESKPKSESRAKSESKLESESKLSKSKKRRQKSKKKSKTRSRSKSEPLADDPLLPATADEVDPPPPTITPPIQEQAPVGLVSNEDPTGDLGGPTFGSDIVIGSDVVPAGPSALEEPFSFEDDFLADIEVDPPASGSARELQSTSDAGRMVSARFSIQDCTIRWGRGGYPDESSPGHELLRLSAERTVFLIDSDDEAAATLQIHDELWVRIEIPAFLEPILVRGKIEDFEGSAGNGGTRAWLAFHDVDIGVQRKLERAADELRLPA